jgi:hypothetical protein
VLKLTQRDLRVWVPGLRLLLRLLGRVVHLLLDLLQGLGEGIERVVGGVGRRLDDEEVDGREGADRDDEADQPERDVAEEVDWRNLSGRGRPRLMATQIAQTHS